ncbi:RNA polymerase sigma factor [Nannocystis bainbridge]|uniref:RNA polymerase sigma factor n=1 Tax=Nannocystis bainbridge TaxID=2995303 RepID=A0ABT5EDT2_9BACT|nr:RNA polymerase sigma factor [Nannocystis bainbridge]MDC0723474.1 RNA polymerase sigma factor [Nannocystis bainbridge]
MDEGALLEAWRGGEAEAGRQLITRYYAAIYRFFYGKTEAGACEDLAQETFELVVRRRDAFRGDSPFRAYVYGIARFVLVAHIRRRQRHGKRFEPAEHSAIDPATEGSVSALFADRELEYIVAQALRSLALDDQILVELKDWEGLTQAELAALFEVPQPTVARRLQRARTRLREAVERLVADPALRDASVHGLDSCMQSIYGKLQAHLGRVRDGER